MIWRASFVALLFASILTACGNRVDKPACPITKNKALSALQPTSEPVAKNCVEQAAPYG